MPDADEKPVFGPPGPELSKVEFKLVEIGFNWLRVYETAYGPIYFSKAGTTRWNAKEGSGALCVGETFSGAFLEVFGDVLRKNGKFLTDPETRKFSVCELSIKDPAKLRIADFRNDELWSIGADSQLFSGRHSVAREWSLAFEKHPQKIDGFLYNSRHNPRNTNVVLFRRLKNEKHLREGDSWVLKDYPDFDMTMRALKIGIAPPQVMGKFEES